MKIAVTSVMVDDQAKALAFYTDKLGFIKKEDIPMGGDARWLTVVSPEAPDGVELLLEPMGIPAAGVFQKALRDAGIPVIIFSANDIQQEYEKLEKLGVVFRIKPVAMGPVIMADFEDTCGNIIKIIQPK